ncbi:MAG: CesT family type III secretion system chaperone [Puniceicoccales bacterium]|jgi:hypothetical protein|nr:CesT family type III secretion system chaperone [Puniceicoccales bacterium]
MDADESFVLRRKLAEYVDFAASKMKSKLQLHSSGICMFKHDQSEMEFAIELPGGSDIVYFYAPICRVPYDFTEQFFEKLLENNLHGVANNQASFGLDRKTQNIVLTYSIAMGHIDAIAFENILFNFMKTAIKAAANTVAWIEEICAKYTLSDEELEDEVGETAKNIKMKV